MKVTPVASPHQIQQPASTDKRAAAIAAFNKASQVVATPQVQAQPTPVLNPNAVSPEELTVVKAKTEEQVVETTEQTGDTSASTVEATSEETNETAESTTPETPTEPEKSQADPALTRQFAQLARQEKALRAKAQQQEQAIKAREDALATKETQIKQLENQYKQGYISLDQLKNDTLGVLAQSGISYDELTQQILTQQPTDPRVNATISRLEAKIQELEAKTQENQTKAQESQQAQYQAAIKQIKTDATKLVNNDPAYEAVKTMGLVDEVVAHIEATYQKDGVVLSVEEAAQYIEDSIVEEAVKLTNLDKIKKRISAASAEAQKTTVKTQAPAATTTQIQQTMKTLTNAAASTRKLSAKERAILAFKGELKP